MDEGERKAVFTVSCKSHLQTFKGASATGRLIDGSAWIAVATAAVSAACAHGMACDVCLSVRQSVRGQPVAAASCPWSVCPAD